MSKHMMGHNCSGARLDLVLYRRPKEGIIVDSVVEQLVVFDQLTEEAIGVNKSNERVDELVEPFAIIDPIVVGLKVGKPSVQIVDLQSHVVDAFAVPFEVLREKRLLRNRLDQLAYVPSS